MSWAVGRVEQFEAAYSERFRMELQDRDCNTNFGYQAKIKS